MSDRERITQFDGLRALAFLGVFLHHGAKVPLLWMGVDLFFVLSGFLITRNLLELRDTIPPGRALGVFFFRRVLRIIPPYYAALTLVLIVHPIGSSHIPWFYGFASNVHDAVQAPFEGSLSSFWSIAVEEQFYIFWPWLVLFLPRRALPYVFGACIAGATIARYAMTPYGFDAVYRLTICRMDLLASGALLALIERADRDWFSRSRQRILLVALGAIGAFALLSITIHSFRTNLNRPLFNVVGFGLSTVFFTAVLAYVRGATGLVIQALRTPVLVYVGTISYMAYLVHEFALDACHRLGLSMIPTAVLGLALTIAMATASWFVLERPLQKLRKLVSPKPLEHPVGMS